MKPNDFVAKQLDLDPDSTAASIGGMIAGGATDPLTFAGGALGRAAGKGIGGLADATATQLSRVTTADLAGMGERYIQRMPISPAVPSPVSAAIAEPTGLGRLRPW